MKLTIVGASPSYPNPGSASSSYLLEQDNSHLLIDCGHGAAGKALDIIDLASVSGIVISHMHPDHFFDLVPLTYAYLVNGVPGVPLWLPPDGRDTLARLQEAVGLAPDFLSNIYEMREYGPTQTIQLGAISIQFTPTHHFIPGYAMRFTSPSAPDRSIMFSSDTSRTDSVVELARGCDLALVEAALPANPSDGEHEGHMTAHDAACLARDAQVQHLVLTHYPRSAAASMLSEVQQVFGQEVSMGRDGDVFEV